MSHAPVGSATIRRTCRPIWIALLAAMALVAATRPATAQTSRRPHADSLAAPQFVHESWTVRDGLPVNSINAIVQSRNGYLWLATFDGLVRFDGVQFTVFNTGNTDGLPSNRIVDLIETRDGSLWLRTQQNHLVRFRGARFTHFGPERGLKDNSTRLLYEDGASTLWVATDDGVGFIQDDRFVPVAGGSSGAPVSAMLRSSDGTMWVGTAGAGLIHLGRQRTTLSAANGLPSDSVTALAEDPDGSLWIGTVAGTSRYRDAKLTPVLDGSAPWRGAILDFHKDSSARTLWISTTGGVYSLHDGRLQRAGGPSAVSRARTFLFDAAGHVWYALGEEIYRDGRLVYRLGDEPPRAPVPALEVHALLLDPEGSLWIGTEATGLHRLKPSLFTVYSEPEGLSIRNIYPILEDRSHSLWLGTWGRGVSRLAGGAIANFTPESGFPAFVLSLLQDQQGKLWLGTFQEGVFVCDMSFRCAAPAGGPPRSTSVYSLYQDRSGNLWIGSDHGLYRSSNGVWTRFAEGQGVPSAPVQSIYETRDGDLWMGTNGGGLLRYRGGRFARFTTADGLPSDLLRSLYQDADGWLWVGTEGRGLARLNPAQLDRARPDGAPASLGESGRNAPQIEIGTWRARDGLFDEVIHAILEDDFGRLWMSSNRGIFWISRAELNAFAARKTSRIHSTAYTERDGLRNREANGGMQPAATKAHDGRLWFATQDGAVVIDPARLMRNSVPPPVVIERVLAADRTISMERTPIQLAAGMRDLQIDYTALSFLAPENMRFRYRLDGYNGDWVEAGNRRSAFYTNVPPGTYTFRVIASNNDGVWNERGASLGLTIAPQFSETAWYYLLLTSVLLALGVGAVRLRVRALRAREEDLRALVEARTTQLRLKESLLETQNAQLEAQAKQLAELDQTKSRFFTNVSHEFRTPLTLTIGPLEDVQSGLYGRLTDEASRQVDMALRSAHRLLRLVNQLLDVARLESGNMKLRAREADIVVFLRGLATAFAAVAERKHIALRIDAPAEPLAVYFDGDALEKVFANLLSNAFKFTPHGGTVALSVESPVDERGACSAVVRISDTGPGIPRGELSHVFERFYQVDESASRLQPGTGIGLSLARELVELHGGQIVAESDDGAGTTMIVTLLLGRTHLHDNQLAAAATNDAPSTSRPPFEAEASSAMGEGDPTPRTAGVNDGDDVTTVLVVEDNAELRDYVRAHLGQRYRIAEAEDGATGLELARTLLPDLVISDVMMPGTDGHELCKAIRSDPQMDFIPVLLLTALASTKEKIAGLEGGADDYLVKPFDMRELEARVANLIASRRRLRGHAGAIGGRIELHASAVDVSSADSAYLERVRAIIEAHLDDEAFGVEELARELGQDRSHLYRRMRALLGETPTDVMRRVRLERGAQLLTARAGTVSEIAYGVGFSSVSYFSKCFREMYGVTPSTYGSSRILESPSREAVTR